jgi:hypothetical protein
MPKFDQGMTLAEAKEKFRKPGTGAAGKERTREDKIAEKREQLRQSIQSARKEVGRKAKVSKTLEVEKNVFQEGDCVVKIGVGKREQRITTVPGLQRDKNGVYFETRAAAEDYLREKVVQLTKGEFDAALAKLVDRGAAISQQRISTMEKKAKGDTGASAKKTASG